MNHRMYMFSRVTQFQNVKNLILAHKALRNIFLWDIQCKNENYGFEI